MVEELNALSLKGAGFLFHYFYVFICSDVGKKTWM